MEGCHYSWATPCLESSNFWSDWFVFSFMLLENKGSAPTCPYLYPLRTINQVCASPLAKVQESLNLYWWSQTPDTNKSDSRWSWASCCMSRKHSIFWKYPHMTLFTHYLPVLGSNDTFSFSNITLFLIRLIKPVYFGFAHRPWASCTLPLLENIMKLGQK